MRAAAVETRNLWALRLVIKEKASIAYEFHNFDPAEVDFSPVKSIA
jgi:hypothetical protein